MVVVGVPTAFAMTVVVLGVPMSLDASIPASGAANAFDTKEWHDSSTSPNLRPA